MKERDKVINRKLKELAIELPINYYEAKASLQYRGSELLEMDPDKKDSKGEPLDAKKIYFINGVQRHQVDHYKRMKRIYRRFGAIGVNQYVAEVVDLHIHIIKPTSIGGIQTQYE